MIRQLLLAAALAANSIAQTEPRAGDKDRLVVVSYYAAKYDGRKTTSGERFSSQKMTAAHLTLPLGTRVQLTNPKTGASVEVTVNDRGPHVKGRDISITRQAAKELGILRQGVGRARMEVLANEGAEQAR